MSALARVGRPCARAVADAGGRCFLSFRAAARRPSVRGGTGGDRVAIRIGEGNVVFGSADHEGGAQESHRAGTIDLVFREKDEWFVVDYKTDATANRLDALTEYYAPQVRLYADFWSRLVGAPTRGGLFFVDGFVERWVL